MYVGYDVPEQFTTTPFIKEIKKLLDTDGTAIFNRLYFGEKRKLAEEFSDKLEGEFSRVTRVFPEANVMFVCNG